MTHRSTTKKGMSRQDFPGHDVDKMNRLRAEIASLEKRLIRAERLQELTGLKTTSGRTGF
jgi:hypothetical protein